MATLNEAFINGKEFTDKLKDIIINGDRSVLTAMEIRHQLEDHFGFERDALKQKPYRKRIGAMTDDIVAALPDNDKEATEEAEEIKPQLKRKRQDSPAQQQQTAAPKSTTKARKVDDSVKEKNLPKQHTKQFLTDSDEDFQEAEHDDKDTETHPSSPKYDEHDDNDKVKEEESIPKKKKKKLVQPAEKDDDDKDEDQKTLSPPTSTKKASTRGKRATSEESTNSNATKEEQIKRLKQFINKCGVRKIWSRELADCPSENAQIRKLRKMLEDLGVKGRPSMEKCEAVKRELELKRELEGLDTSLIIDNDDEGIRPRRRRAAAQSKPTYVQDENEEENDEEEEDEKDGEAEDDDREEAGKEGNDDATSETEAKSTPHSEDDEDEDMEDAQEEEEEGDEEESSEDEYHESEDED